MVIHVGERRVSSGLATPPSQQPSVHPTFWDLLHESAHTVRETAAKFCMATRLVDSTSVAPL